MTKQAAIAAARQSGQYAALEPPQPRQVPDQHKAFAEVWLQAYDDVRHSLRNSFPVAA